MASAVFWPFDYFEGYLLFDLLAPWGAVTSPFLRAPFVWVSWLGLNGARLLLITYAAFWAGAISSFKRASQPLVPSEIEGWRVNFGLERAKLISKIGIGLLLLTSALLAPGFICRDNIPGWSSSIGAVHAGFERMRQVDESAHTANLSSAIARLIAANPAVTVVITPESAFPFCCLDYHQSCARLRKASAGRLLLLGSNRCAGEALCNTSFAFYANGDLTWYDKIHRMFYAERVPSFLTYLGLHDTLVSWIGYEFTAGTCCHPVFSVPKPAGTAVLPSLRPCLCSELFFTDCLAHDPNQSLPVAAQVNDAWYPGTPIPELLWAVARLKACAYGRVIIYVSYTHANIMLPHGELQELHSCT
jgi:apolipoprotein N-acyltransferase